MSAGQSPLGAPPYMSDGRSLTSSEVCRLPAFAAAPVRGCPASCRASHRWPIGHLQKHRKCDALTPRV